MVAILRRGLLVVVEIEEDSFRKKTRKGAAVFTARTSFGMTGIFVGKPRMPT